MTTSTEPTGGLAKANLVAQCGALVSVSLASLLVARAAGPAGVGIYALLRLLPWLIGVLLSGGLPVASAYMLSSGRVPRSSLKPTIIIIATMSGLAGTALWLALAPVMHRLFFSIMPLSLVLLAAPLVLTQLITVTAKACCQGGDDLPGSNRIIVAEEFAFLPGYGLVLAVGFRGTTGVVLALLMSGAIASVYATTRLLRIGFGRDWTRPTRTAATELFSYGARGQFGNLLWLLNLRLDFLVLDVLAGPAVLGVYAVASKAAELMRLPATALNYVLYPRYAAQPVDEATRHARHLLPRAALLTVCLAPVVAIGTATLLPILYGSNFQAAVLPALILVLGLAPEGAAAVSSAYLLGTGRPGLNSLGMAVGVTVTVALDVLLIPTHGAIGAAIASTTAYLTTTTVLVVLSRLHSATHPVRTRAPVDTWLRRLVDVGFAWVALLLCLPLLAALAITLRLGGGPALYRQTRVGRGGKPFTILKFRTMVAGADRQGPLVTQGHDSRVTRIGGLLRGTHLDELPQLVNVLRGDMTLVGPRPEVPRYVEDYTVAERRVLDVRPGLTGPGQVAFSTDYAVDLDAAADPERHYLDYQLHPKLAVELAYLEGRDARRDLRLLICTAALVIRREPFRGRDEAGDIFPYPDVLPDTSMAVVATQRGAQT